MAQSSFGYFALQNESVPGTSPATDMSLFLPVKDVDFPVDVTFIEIMEIAGSRQAFSSFDGPVRPDVTFSTAFYPAGGMGTLLRGLFGSVSTAAVSGSTAKLHTFGDAVALPSISFERSDARASGGIIQQRVSGCKIESMSFSCAYGEDVNVQVSAQGIHFPTTPASKPTTFTYPTMNPFIFTGASVKIDDIASLVFKSVDFEITNTLERQEALNKTREAYKIMEGGLKSTLTGTLIFDDLTIYNKLKNSTYLSVEVDFEGDVADSMATPSPVKYAATFKWPKVKVSKFGIPMTAGEIMEADVEFSVQFDKTTNELVHCTLTNNDALTVYTAAS